MYALDFEEFLLANEQLILLDMIKEHFENLTPMPEIWHKKALEYYRTFTIVGGMPAVINEQLSEKNTLGVAEVQEMIINSYIADMSKYSSNSESVRIRESYESLPAQLAKDNKKFQWKVISKGANAKIFGDSTEWLVSSGIVLKTFKTESKKPLSSYKDLSSFKLYMSDLGLLCHKLEISYSDLISNDDKLFTGGLAENYVACTLKSNGYDLFYWTSEGIAEIDFLIQKEGEIIPIEVKANLHTKSKSLETYKNKYKPKYSIRISAKNFGFENGCVHSLPYDIINKN